MSCLWEKREKTSVTLTCLTWATKRMVRMNEGGATVDGEGNQPLCLGHTELDTRLGSSSPVRLAGGWADLEFYRVVQTGEMSLSQEQSTETGWNHLQGLSSLETKKWGQKPGWVRKNENCLDERKAMWKVLGVDSQEMQWFKEAAMIIIITTFRTHSQGISLCSGCLLISPLLLALSAPLFLSFSHHPNLV